MKKIFSIAISILVLAACKEKKHGPFTVSGQIINAPGSKVYLVETPFGNTPEVILDSTLLKEKGDFTLKGRANEEGIFRLVLESGPNVVLINDNDDIKVRVNVNDYRSYSVEGSPASASLHQLFEDYRDKDSLIIASFKIVDSLKSLPGQDSLVQSIQTKNDERIEALNKMLRNYITKSESPAAALYALGIASQTIKNEELVTMINETAKKFPENSGLARVKSLVAVQSAEPRQTAGYALLNQPAPNLTMTDVNGKTVNVSDFKGKYLLLDFWASWCAPCRQENPNVVAAYNKFKNRNFTILGVSLDENRESWKKAIQQDGLTWSHMSDLKQWESSAVQPYGIEGIPFNVLIDPAGKIIASSLRGEELTKKLEEVLQ